MLALRLRGPVVVAGAHDDDRFAPRLRDAREVRRERRVATAVSRDLHAVHPDRRVVIDGLEMEQRPAPLPRRGDGHLPPVPDRVHEIRGADPRERRLGAERDRDPGREGTVAEAALQPGVAGVDLELPLTVQAEPVLPRELRTRILGARRFHG